MDMTANKTLKTAAMIAACINSASLHAQAEGDALPKAETLQAAEPAGFGVPWTERESLFLQPLVEKALPDSGFTPTLSWTGEQWSNVSGGMERGTMWNSLFTMGFEQDFSRLLKVENAGRFGVSAFYNANSHKGGRYFDSLYSAPSNIFSGDMIRVFEIFYANSFDTEIGTFSFRVGQLAADEDFMGMDYADLFLNSNFGAIPAVAGALLHNGNIAFSQYANATLGAVVSYENGGFDVTLGVYNGSAGDDVSSNNGFDYDLEGAAFWYQLGYNYEIAGLAGRVQFGGNYHSGRFENFATGGTGRNFYSFFLGIQQDVLNNGDGDPVLGLYARFACAPEDEISENTVYMEGGLNWFAPIPGRDDDVFGIGVSSMYMGGDAREASGGELTRYQTVVETTYRVQFTPAISLQPSFQVYFNPYDNDGGRTACFVAGARLEVLF